MTNRTELGHHVRMHAVAVRACMVSAESEHREAIRDMLQGCTEPFALDPSDLPHTLVPVPRDEVWLITGDGERIVLGPRTEVVR